jgi:hypothetical protein
VQRLLPHHDFAPEPGRDGALVRAHYHSSGYAEEVVRLFERGALGSRASEVVQPCEPKFGRAVVQGRPRASPPDLASAKCANGPYCLPSHRFHDIDADRAGLRPRGLHAISKACRACASARVTGAAKCPSHEGPGWCKVPYGCWKEGDDWSLSAVAGSRTC